ncbi:MAG TPA: hypothetical protein VJI69_04695, partial [Bacteroidia bacterium]|nr:hypothetical protein [Bacteroidia bacterium]
MSEDFGENENKGAQYLLILVDRFEEMINNNKQYFFDAEELEEIIDYYFEKNNSKRALSAIDFAIGQYP